MGEMFYRPTSGGLCRRVEEANVSTEAHWKEHQMFDKVNFKIAKNSSLLQKIWQLNNLPKHGTNCFLKADTYCDSSLFFLIWILHSLTTVHRWSRCFVIIQFRREYYQHLRRSGQFYETLVFYVLVTYILFPLL